jgi:hypothetical protein
MDPNGGAVDHLDVAVMGSGDGVHHPVPNARFAPSHEAIVAGGPSAIALRQVTPWRTGAKYPEDTIQHASIIDARYSTRLAGQKRLDHAPLEVGQVISAHVEPESHPAAIWKAH